MMSRLIDRIIERVAPKATASACSSTNLCNSDKSHVGYWNRFCCPQGGCAWHRIKATCP
jgi:hypothetical protein